MFHVEHFFSKRAARRDLLFVSAACALKATKKRAASSRKVKKTVVLSEVEEAALSERSEPNRTPSLPAPTKPPQGISTTISFPT
jgi:hypothetical protein